jgi:hypothetical protein
MMKNRKRLTRLALAMLSVGALSGCSLFSSDSSAKSTELTDHPRTYPDGLMTSDLKYMDDYQSKNNKVLYDTFENWGKSLINTNIARVHANYFADYPYFNIDEKKGTISNTPSNLSNIGKYMFTKEMTVYAVTGKNHTCVYSLYYLFGADDYENKIYEIEIKYASVTVTVGNCLTYDMEAAK